MREHPAIGAPHPVRGRGLQRGRPRRPQPPRALDGAGYPEGLEGIDPALARVIAVADSYNAMTSDRRTGPP